MWNGAHDTGRVARSDRVGGDIFRDDGAGTDNDSVTQGDTLKNHRTSPKEAAATNLYRLGVFGVFGEPRKAWAESVKIIIENHRASPKDCVFADFN